MLTPLGILLRELRGKRHLRLLDLAARLNHSSAFVSAIETGRKPIPHDFTYRVAQTLGLSEEEKEQLEIAESKTRGLVRIDHLNDPSQTLVAIFARRLEKLSPEEIEALKKSVKYSSISGETPFHRKQHGFAVRPRSIDEIRGLADKVRSTFVDDDEVLFPVMDVLEFRFWKVFEEYHLDIRWKDDLGNEEGRVYANSGMITLRDDVYRVGWEGEDCEQFTAACYEAGRARFTACHELGHWLMHRNIGHVRTWTPDLGLIYDSEWQADAFAGELLVARRHLDRFTDAREVAEKCRISLSAAEVQLDRYRRENCRR